MVYAHRRIAPNHSDTLYTNSDVRCAVPAVRIIAREVPAPAAFPPSADVIGQRPTEPHQSAGGCARARRAARELVGRHFRRHFSGSVCTLNIVCRLCARAEAEKEGRRRSLADTERRTPKTARRARKVTDYTHFCAPTQAPAVCTRRSA